MALVCLTESAHMQYVWFDRSSFWCCRIYERYDSIELFCGLKKTSSTTRKHSACVPKELRSVASSRFTLRHEGYGVKRRTARYAFYFYSK